MRPCVSGVTETPRTHPAAVAVGRLKASDRNVQRLGRPWGSWGEGHILIIRCNCGHDLERHLTTEACDVKDCRCLGFAASWEEEDEEIVRA